MFRPGTKKLVGYQVIYTWSTNGSYSLCQTNDELQFVIKKIRTQDVRVCVRCYIYICVYIYIYIYMTRSQPFDHKTNQINWVKNLLNSQQGSYL